MTEQLGSGVLAAGDWIGGFEILERLRSGGMATLYLARRHGTAGFSRRIALKVIHPHLTYDARFVSMFVDEARICSYISHPNVVHVEEFGVDGGLHYLAMEYIDGCSLTDVMRLLALREEGLSVELATRIAMQVAAGLHAAHLTLGEDHQPLHIIHRDISPSNILISRDGNIKVIDFGVAKARGRLAATAATDGTIKGKLRYMSPEQALRQEVDARSDLYSLGVVYWELLTGSQLWAEEEDEITLLWKRMANEAIPLASSLSPELSPLIDSLVAKMLARDPDDRFESAWACRRMMCEVEPRALAVDTAELGALVAEVAALPPPVDLLERSPILEVAPVYRRSMTSIPRVIVDLDAEITVHPAPRPLRRALAIVVPALVACALIAAWFATGEPAGTPFALPVLPAPPPVQARVATPPPAPPPRAPERVVVVAHAPRPERTAPRRRIVAPPPIARVTAPPPADPRPVSIGKTMLADQPDDASPVGRSSQKPTSVGKTTIAPAFEE